MPILNKVFNIGIDSQSDINVKRIRILNGIAFFAALILIFNGIMIFVSSYPFERFTFKELVEYLISNSEIRVADVKKFRIIFPLLDFFLAFFAFVSLFLNYFRKQEISSIVICLIANFYIAFFYWISGFFSAFFFFIPALLPLIFFQKARQYYSFLILTLIIFITLTIIKYNNGINDLFLQPPADKALLNSLLNFTAVFGILYFIVFHFKKENSKNEEMLTEKNKILDQQSKEIKVQRDELRQKNNRLSASEKELKELNATKDKFISILAHDLKNPFNSLFGFSELLLKNYKEYDDNEIEYQLKLIYQASKTTYDHLEQVLLWAKSQSGKLTIKPEKFSFVKVTHDLINEFKNQTNQKNIKINLSESEKISVTADINMIKTVMRNLITNAIKFNHENGQINISAEMNAQNVIVTISDNGTGIDKTIIPKLWEIKENHTTPGTNDEPGTGFGLKLCKELIDKHHGNIWVESEVGKGSEFKFSLPLIYK